jgi:hypothetical protein
VYHLQLRVLRGTRIDQLQPVSSRVRVSTWQRFPCYLQLGDIRCSRLDCLLYLCLWLLRSARFVAVHCLSTRQLLPCWQCGSHPVRRWYLLPVPSHGLYSLPGWCSFICRLFFLYPLSCWNLPQRSHLPRLWTGNLLYDRLQQLHYLRKQVLLGRYQLRLENLRWQVQGLSVDRRQIRGHPRPRLPLDRRTN